MVARAYAKQGVKHDDLMQRLADVSIQTAPRMSPQSLSNVTWSFAMLAVHRPDLMAAVEGEVCRRAAGFAPQGLANVAWYAHAQGEGGGEKKMTRTHWK